MSLLYDEAQQAIAAESRKVLEARVQTRELLGLLEQRHHNSVQYTWALVIAAAIRKLRTSVRPKL